MRYDYENNRSQHSYYFPTWDGKMIPMLANPKVQEFITLLQDPEVYPVFQCMVMQVLTDQDGPKLIQRVKNIERHLGANDDWCVWEDVEGEGREVLMPITEMIDLISGRIEDVSLPVLKETVFSGNKTEVRARLLKDHLPDVDMRNGKRFLTSQEVQKFLLYEIDEAHRTTEKAARKVANDVMKKAFEMFPESLILTKNKKRLNVIEFIEKR